MKLGFQLKPSSKRKRIAGVNDEDEEVKEEVLCIEGTSVVTVNNTAKEKSLLVIPLQKGINGAMPKIQGSTADESLKDIKTERAPLTLDEMAAAELLAEVRGEKSSDHRQLIIGSVDNNSKSDKYVPILLANLPQELLGISDDSDRFKVDISLRPDEVDVRSDVYKSIPVEEFGAALLRGMGWAGPTEEEEANKLKAGFDIVPRESRLGLGAVAKPPDERGYRGNKKKKEEERKKWAGKAQAVLAKQQLQDGDLVWLRDPLYAGRRADVTATKGVPGLDRIRVCLESSGEEVIIKRTDAVLLTDVDLEEKPYRPTMKSVHISEKEVMGSVTSRHMIGDKSGNGREDHTRDLDRMDIVDERDSSKDRKKDRKNGSNDGNNNQRNDDKEHSKKYVAVSHSDSQSSTKGGDSEKGKSGEKDSSDSYWIREGIRVRIVSKKAGPADGSVYLKKGVIRSVSKDFLASIQLLDDSRAVVTDVKQKHLETVIPNTGELCMVVRGKYRGKEGTLREKRKEKEEVVLRLQGTSEDIVLAMDYVAAIS